jgi:phytoene dehydrogenase-like protein
MSRSVEWDAVVIGSGPNGLAAAITLAREGLSVRVLEGKSTWGGGTRTLGFTLPGFRHDVCSAIHPMGIASPFFQSVDLESHGLRWLHPEFPLVQPLDGGRAIVHERSVELTAARLGRDEASYCRIFDPLTQGSRKLYADLLGPLSLPRHPFAAASFGRRALLSAKHLAESSFRTPEARALIAGHAAHSVLPLEAPGTAAFALMLGVSAHAVGWPVAEGGSQAIADALVGLLRSLGGDVICDHPVQRFEDLPSARVYLFDTAPSRLAEICGERLPSGYRAALQRFRHGPGAFKVDWALSNPIPWTHPDGARTASLHLGASFEEIANSERSAWKGAETDRPFLIVAQPSLIDPTRAPAGRHTAWAYAHVPASSRTDLHQIIESQIERFAPGFRDLILGRHIMDAGAFEAYNPNYVGGDIVGGVQDLRQLYARPVDLWNPYTTPDPKVFLCSASTPPGAGVHGMCGYHAARAALRRLKAARPT